VIGDNKPFVAAFISLDGEMLPIWLGSHGLNKDLSVAEASKLPEVMAEVEAAVKRVNKTVSKAEEIKKFVILDQELTEATGHVTPSMKIKRNVVLQDFAQLAAEMYGEK
jgi:long-chain acyl-CoA synthetase